MEKLYTSHMEPNTEPWYNLSLGPTLESQNTPSNLPTELNLLVLILFLGTFGLTRMGAWIVCQGVKLKGTCSSCINIGCVTVRVCLDANATTGVVLGLGVDGISRHPNTVIA